MSISSIVSRIIPAAIGYATGGPVGAFTATVGTEQAKSEQKNQERQAGEAQQIIAKQQLETPPNVNWGQGWNVFRGSVVRHGVKAGLNFAIANGQGQFFYNHNAVSYTHLTLPTICSV